MDRKWEAYTPTMAKTPQQWLKHAKMQSILPERTKQYTNPLYANKFAIHLRSIWFVIF